MNTAQLNNGLAWVSAKAAAAYNGCHWMLSAGSAFMIYKVIISKALEQGVNIWLATVAAWIIAAVWYQAIEHTLKVLLPFAVGFIMSSKDDKKNTMTKEQRRTGRMSVVVSSLLLIATGGLSFFINPHISTAVNTLEDSSVEIAQNESVRSSYDKDVAIYQAELADAKEADKQAVSDAKEDAAAWVVAAQNVRGVELGKLIREDNKWAKDQLSDAQTLKIKTETSRGERHVQKARDNATAPTLQRNLTAYMERSGSARDSVAVATMGIIKTRRTAYEGKVSGMNYTLFFLVLSVLILFVFMCFLMVNVRLSKGEEIVDDDSPGVFKVVKKSALNLNKKWAKQLADKWKVDFVSTPPALSLAADNSLQIKSEVVSTENSLPSNFQHIKSESDLEEVSESQEEVSEKVNTPPPAGFAVPKKVNAGFWVDDAVKYRKRVYGWWSTAHNAKKGRDTREDNRKKAEDAFTWFESQGCTVTKKGAGKVSIKFPKA